MVTSLVQGLPARKGQRPRGPSDSRPWAGASCPPPPPPHLHLPQLPRSVSGFGFKGSIVGVNHSKSQKVQEREVADMPSVPTWLPGSPEAPSFSGFRTPTRASVVTLRITSVSSTGRWG